MIKLVSLLVISVALLACKDEPASSPPAQPPAAPASAAAPDRATAAKPVEAPKPAGAPAVALGAGESLATLLYGTNPTAWSAGGQQISVAVVVKDGKAWARAYAGTQQFDLTNLLPIDEDNTFSIAPTNGGAAMRVELRSLADRKAEALFAHEHRLITWDAGASKPVASDKWECDETKAKDGDCTKGPEWTSAAAPAPGGAAPH